MSHSDPFACEALEPRVLLSIAINVDYSFDANGFFDDPARREVMEAAADYVGSLLNDSLAAIVPSGGNNWRIRFNDPATGTTAEVANPVIDEDELLLFVGGRDLGGDTLGLGGAGGWQASGSSSFLLLVEGRGQSGATGPDAGQTDTSLWGGSIVFDVDSPWHFGLTTERLAGNENDFYSVAVHEIFHTLGFTDGTPAFFNLISPSNVFLGPAAMAVSGDTQLQATDLAHWREGLASAGQETLMDPTFSRGTRKLVTPLDFAAMQDIGWELDEIRYPGRGSQLALSIAGTGLTSGTATPSAPGLHWVDVREEGLLDFRVQSVNPVGLRLWDSRGLLVEEVAADAGIASLSTIATDQFYTIELVAEFDTDYDLSVTNANLDVLAYYPEGFAADEIDQYVTVSNPTDIAQLFTLSLRYERAGLGRDADSVAFEQLIEPGQTVTVDIVRNRVYTPDVITTRAILGNEPYALVLASTAPLAAAVEHRDVFGGQEIVTAEDFTRLTDDRWTFASVEKADGVFDFVVFYNPNDHDAQVTITFINQAGQVRFTQEVRSQARGGLNLQDTGDLPDGRYGVIVSSVALDAADQPAHDGIVAGVTHFDGNTGEGWTTLGRAGAPPASGLLPLASLPGQAVRANVFNPGSSTITLRLTRTTASGTEALADRFLVGGITTTLTLPEALGYSYEFVGGEGTIQLEQGSGASFSGAAQRSGAADTRAFALEEFGAGEPGAVLRLSAANPTAFATTVTVRFLFGSGAEEVRSLAIGAMGFATLDIDTIGDVTSRVAGSPLAILLESTRAFDAMLLLQDADDAWASAGMALPA